MKLSEMLGWGLVSVLGAICYLLLLAMVVMFWRDSDKVDAIGATLMFVVLNVAVIIFILVLNGN